MGCKESYQTNKIKQMHENLNKNVNENIHIFMQFFMSLYEGQVKQQTCYSFTLLISYNGF